MQTNKEQSNAWKTELANKEIGCIFGFVIVQFSAQTMHTTGVKVRLTQTSLICILAVSYFS